MSYFENAKIALKSFNDIYYRAGSFKGTMFWDRAELIEMVADACEKLGDEYKVQLQEVINTSIAISGTDWAKNPYYDDILWMCLAFARASVILENSDYLTIAKNNFNYVTENGIVELGLVDHKKGNGEGNTISSTTYVVVASILGKLLNEKNYQKKAKAMLDAIMANLYNNSNGHVFDHVNADGTKEFFAHDSNFGMFARACSEVYEFTNDIKYFDAMQLAIEHLITLKYKSGVMCNHNTGDAAGFKAIFVRQVSYIASKYKIEDYTVWLRINADSVWENRNKYNLMQNDFCSKTADHRLWSAFDCHSAIVLILSCI